MSTSSSFPALSKLTALPHQERTADKLEENGAGEGLLAYHGIGSGKTFSSINAAKRLKLPILAITPAGLRNNFKKEMDAAGNPVPYSVVSYREAVNRLHDQKFRDEAHKSLVVYDEAHRLGQEETQRSQLPKMLPSAKNLMLTATPIRNSPHEIAPLINAAHPHSLPSDPHEFDKKYVETREIPVGFWGKLVGAKPGVERLPKNLDQFARAIRGKVDFHESVDRTHYPSFSESIVEVPMASKQQAAYDYMLGKYPALAYKVKHGIPPSKSEEKNFTAFFSGPRMVSNHPGAFNASATDADAPKFISAADEIEKRYKTDRNFRGVVYSNFLEAGVEPMQRELKRRGIESMAFTGELNDKQRKHIVDSYNSGETPVLILSGAGAEGLDLKGTKLMQILEPHWNEELMDQVRGRTIRYKSHSHLPEAERHVEVQRFHAVPVRNFIGRLTAKKPHGRGVDQYLYEVAKKKRELNQPFLDVLKEEGEKAAAMEVNPRIEHTGTTDDGIKMFCVDGKKVRDEIQVNFSGGGNGYAYPAFIPPDELWYEKQASDEDTGNIILHELVELRKMRDEHKSYAPAHDEANKAEAVARGNDKPIDKEAQILHVEFVLEEEKTAEDSLPVLSAALASMKPVESKPGTSVMSRANPSDPLKRFDYSFELAKQKKLQPLPRIPNLKATLPTMAASQPSNLEVCPPTSPTAAVMSFPDSTG